MVDARIVRDRIGVYRCSKCEMLWSNLRGFLHKEGCEPEPPEAEDARP